VGRAAGRSNLSPVWFDYEGDRVLLKLGVTHRKKLQWLRQNPEATFILMNPANPFHWISIKATLTREISEDDPDDGATGPPLRSTVLGPQSTSVKGRWVRAA